MIFCTVRTFASLHQKPRVMSDSRLCSQQKTCSPHARCVWIFFLATLCQSAPQSDVRRPQCVSVPMVPKRPSLKSLIIDLERDYKYLKSVIGKYYFCFISTTSLLLVLSGRSNMIRSLDSKYDLGHLTNSVQKSNDLINLRKRIFAVQFSTSVL